MANRALPIPVRWNFRLIPVPHKYNAFISPVAAAGVGGRFCFPAQSAASPAICIGLDAADPAVLHHAATPYGAGYHVPAEDLERLHPLHPLRTRKASPLDPHIGCPCRRPVAPSGIRSSAHRRQHWHRGHDKLYTGSFLPRCRTSFCVSFLPLR